MDFEAEAARIRRRWGQNVRDARDANGLTQQVLADKCGKNQSTISKAELGMMSLPLQLRLAAALGRSPAALFPLALHTDD